MADELSRIHIFNGGVHHEPFQRLLADSLQVTVRLAVALGVAALVVIAVSYTHLDVYKRQGFPQPTPDFPPPY